MTPLEKAKDLIEKFNTKASEQVLYTLDIWNIKRSICLKNNDKKGLEISNRTLIYWKLVLNIINKE